MESDKVAKALEQIPYAISVVTVGRGGVENGLTVSWLTQASFDPPHLAVAVDSQHYSIEFLRSTRNFTVNLLGEGQERLAAHFARQSRTGEEKLDDVPTRESETGSAVLADALAYFDCEVVAAHEVGDHTLFVGRVVDAAVLREGKPLTTFSGMRYRRR